uniref:Uncharacterized protein n=1 Tax=Bracon brevicornis TaxID=1563983 RepID=A0A6V7MBX2_9HYME
MVWDDGLSVKEVNEEKKKTPKFPSRERNFAVRRRGQRQALSIRESGVSIVDNSPGMLASGTANDVHHLPPE